MSDQTTTVDDDVDTSDEDDGRTAEAIFGDIAGNEGFLSVDLTALATAATASATKKRIPVPFAMEVVGVRLAVTTAPAGSDIIVDVNKALKATPTTYVTLYTTQGNRPRIVDASTESTAANGAKVPDVTAFAKDDLLTFDVDQIGSGTAGSGLVATVHYVKL